MSDEVSSPSSSSEIKTGRSADLAAGGFKEMPAAPERKERDFATAREAGKDLSLQRQVDNWGQPKEHETVPVEYRDGRGNKAPANEAITLERAAADRKAWTEAQESQAELGAAVEFERDISLNRFAEGLDANPETDARQPQLEQQPQIEQPATPGLDPRVAELLQHKQVREHLEAENAKTTAVQTEYSRAVANAYKSSLAIVGNAFPELQHKSNEQIVETLRQMQVSNPKRFERAYTALQGAAQVETAMIADQKRQIEHHEKWAAEQDQVFERSIRDRTPQQRAAIGEETIRAAAEMGVSKPQLIDALRQNPVLRSAVMQRFFVELAEARIAKREGAKALKAVPVVPPVVRPGVRSAVASPGQASLDALNKKLSGAKTQESQLRAAAEILANRRKR